MTSLNTNSLLLHKALSNST